MDQITESNITGLNSEQVQQRVAQGLNNRKIESSTTTISFILKSNIFTYFNFVFIVLALLLAMVGAWRDMLFIPIIVANTLIGIIQEVHSKRVLDKLSILSEAKVKVLREGELVEVRTEELVLDDLVLLEAGNQIPADAVVVSGQAAVNEALITGEADEIIKTAEDNLLSGSFIVSGSVYARLTKVGKDSYVSQLTIQATKSKKGEQSEMIRSLNKLIVIVGILIIPIGICLFAQSFVYNNGNLHDSITGMVAAIIGMIPEGLYLLSSVAMAVSTVRLAQKKVLVHDMKCIETLARVNVLCVDKTGTITEAGMQVYSVEGVDDSYNQEQIERLLSDFAGNMPVDNETMAALQRYFTKGDGRTASKVFSFSSEYKYSGAVIDNDSYVLGAPEFVISQSLDKYRSIIDHNNQKGFRVLAFGKYSGQLEGKALNGKVEPICFIMLSNPIRKGAKETFDYFQQHQVEIKVISGDNPVTVSTIAKEAGINNADRYIDATSLVSEQDYYNAVENYTVFGRVRPNQKRELIKALKRHENTVAMTGDGVNDVLALKDADCSVAMATGSEAAANASQLVLLDSDFSRMPSVVMEGRRVVNNIERTASLYIVKNIFSMLLALFSAILVIDYPFVPVQLSLIGAFTIGIPTFFLALEQNKNPIRGKFLINVILRALPSGLTDFLVVAGLMLFGRVFDIEADCIATSCTILVTLVGFLTLYRVAQPMKKGHIILMIGLICGWLFCALFLGKIFAITGISGKCAWLTAIFAIITEPVLRYSNKGVEYLRQHINSRNNNN